MARRPLCKAKYCKTLIGGSLCVWERYCTITLGWLEFSNVGFIVILDAEIRNAKEDGEDHREEDNKKDGDKDVPATSLERTKRKRKNTRTTAQKQKKRKRRKETAKPTPKFNHLSMTCYF